MTFPDLPGLNGQNCEGGNCTQEIPENTNVPGSKNAPGLRIAPASDGSVPGPSYGCKIGKCKNSKNPCSEKSVENVKCGNIDPIIDISPPSEAVINEIQPEIMGQCALRRQNILIVFENAEFTGNVIS